MQTLMEHAETAAPELSLGTGLILSLFFGVTLVSAVFFGMGYSFGITHGVSADTFSLRGLLHGSAQPTATAATNVQSASSAAAQPEALPMQHAAVDSARMQPAAIASADAASSTAAAEDASTTAVLGDPVLPKSVTATPHAAAGAYILQIAASANRKDAQFLVTRLRRAGLRAHIQHAAQDRFFRVQMGPFTTHDNAAAARSKVLAAGFKAILKTNN